MSKLMIETSLRRFLFAAFIVAAAGASAWALPAFSWTKVYFASGDIVGEETLLCSGSRSLEGRRTSSWIYVIYESCNVCNPEWQDCLPS